MAEARPSARAQQTARDSRERAHCALPDGRASAIVRVLLESLIALAHKYDAAADGPGMLGVRRAKPGKRRIKFQVFLLAQPRLVAVQRVIDVGTFVGQYPAFVSV